MKIKQLSLIIPNEPDALAHVCEVLEKNNIDITTLTVGDTTDFGILRLIIQNWEDAKTALEREGLVLKVTDVIALSIPNKVGGLLSVLKVLAQAKINIEYMYGFSVLSGENCVQVLRLDDVDRGLDVLKKSHVIVLKKAELFEKA